MQFKYVKKVDFNQLTNEIGKAGLSSAIDNISVNGNVLDITTKRILTSTEQIKLYNIVLSHNPASTQITNKVLNAMDFGKTMIVEVGVENIMLGYTPIQVMQILTKFAPVKAMLESGSLYTALVTLQSTKPDALVSQERLDKYIKRLKEYLGM